MTRDFVYLANDSFVRCLQLLSATNFKSTVVRPELRETVFTNAVDIVLADGIVEEDEKQFIDDLQGKLEIDGKRAKAIVQVMIYKNAG